MASPENVSSTQTAALLPHATNSRFASFDSAIAFGCSPVASSISSTSESAVYICTVDPPHNDTYTDRPSGDTTTVYGSAGSGTVFVTAPEARSMADRVCAKTRVAKSVRPLGLTATPPANVSPLWAGNAKLRARVATPEANVNS